MDKYIYKITNNINGKIYIGQTIDIARRFREHRQCGYNQVKNKVLYNAIKKYGIDNFTFEVIEYVNNYNEREQFWIQYYNSADPEYGYNIEVGGVSKPHKTEVNEAEYESICNDLLNTNLSFQEIAQKYNFISAQSIRDLNKGKIYYHSNKKYPIRPDRNTLAHARAKQIIAMLKQQEYSIKDIADYFQINLSQVYEINSGRRCKIQGEEYPIRQTEALNRKKGIFLSASEVESLKKDIINTSLSWKELGEKYGVGQKVCQHINQGITYFDIKLTYPLRQTRKSKNLTEEQIDNIYNDLLYTDKKQKEIAKEQKVSESAVNSINVGRYHRRSNTTYPLRK